MDARDAGDARNTSQPDASFRRPSAQGFDLVYTSVTRNPTFQRIRREVLGDEHPDGITPYSWVTRSDLRRLAHELRVGRGQTFLDLGCGEGGPGLWVARATGAAVVGVDISPVATAHAEQLAYALGLGGWARYVATDAGTTGLEADSLDGAMSIDVLQLLPDRAAAIAEVARVLRTGAHFTFTTWDATRMPPGRVPLADHRPLLESAGFAVVVYEETPHWRLHMQTSVDEVVAHLPALRAELGDELANALAEDNAAILPYLDHMRRILVVARRGELAGSAGSAGTRP